MKLNSLNIYEFALNNTNISSYDLNKLVNAICKIKNAEYIYKFLINIPNLSVNNIKDLINTLLETSNIIFINKLIKNTKDHNYIVDSICKLKNPWLIHEIIINNEKYLNEDAVNKLILRICILKDIRCIISLAANCENLNEKNIAELFDVVIENKNINSIIEFIIRSKNLSKNKLDEVIDKLYKNLDSENLYHLAKAYYDKYNEKNKLLIVKILNEGDIKYICLVSIFIDKELINKIFNGIDNLYEFIEYSEYFNATEIKSIKKNLYKENYDNYDKRFNEEKLLNNVKQLVYA